MHSKEDFFSPWVEMNGIFFIFVSQWGSDLFLFRYAVRILFFAITLLVYSAPCIRAEPSENPRKKPTSLSSLTSEDVTACLEYLKNVSTLMTPFQQIIVQKGRRSVSKGMLYLDRKTKEIGPRLRIDYEAAVGQTLMVEKGKLKKYNAKRKSLTEISLRQSPLAFFVSGQDLAKTLIFKKGHKKDHRIALCVQSPGNNTPVWLFFHQDSSGAVSLLGWYVVDWGCESFLSFVNPKWNVKSLPKEVFTWSSKAEKAKKPSAQEVSGASSLKAPFPKM